LLAIEESNKDINLGHNHRLCQLGVVILSAGATKGGKLVLKPKRKNLLLQKVEKVVTSAQNQLHQVELQQPTILVWPLLLYKLGTTTMQSQSRDMSWQPRIKKTFGRGVKIASFFTLGYL